MIDYALNLSLKYGQLSEKSGQISMKTSPCFPSSVLESKLKASFQLPSA